MGQAENQEYIINVNDASVRFNLSSERVDSIKEYFIKLVKHQLMFQEFIALQHINLHIKAGEAWGIVGTNGSGKSTLLKLICGILKPYTGSVSIHGTMAPLIELGAGFDSDLTARENIFLNGAVLGHSKQFMKAHFEEIVEFAELGQFIDVPIKNYSSGMAARLGFSIATIVRPEILIVDEILAVGDIAFQQKCEKRMNEMLANNATLLYVSHSINSVMNLCTHAIWLKNGRAEMIGEVDRVCTAYISAMNQSANNLFINNEG